MRVAARLRLQLWTRLQLCVFSSSSPPQFGFPVTAFFGKLGMFTNVAVVLLFFFNLQVLLVSSELLIIAFTRWTDVYVFVFEEKS